MEDDFTIFWTFSLNIFLLIRLKSNCTPASYTNLPKQVPRPLTSDLFGFASIKLQVGAELDQLFGFSITVLVESLKKVNYKMTLMEYVYYHENWHHGQNAENNFW